MRPLALVNAGPPAPPLPPPLKTLDDEAHANSSAVDSPPPSSSLSYSPSLLIIAAILGFVVVASLAIHLLLRFLSSRSSHSRSLVHPRSSTTSSVLGSASPPSSSSTTPRPSDRDREKEGEKDREALISALPVFTLATAVVTAPKSPGDCAVCLSRFRPHDALRLLPACRHAFHAHCVDVWLRSTPSCPLCRSSIDTPTPLPPPPPPPPAVVPAPEERRSGSFRVEIGSVSRRRTGDAQPPPPQHGRSYSIGSAFEYLVEDEVEAVVARALQRPPAAKERKPESERRAGAGPPPPGAQVAEAVGERGGSWLRDYVDRLASSASSSFSSLRFSSRRFDGGASFRGGGDSWDLEGNHNRMASASASESLTWGGDDGGYSFLRWLLGIPS